MIAFLWDQDKCVGRKLFGISVADKGCVAVDIVENFVVRMYLTLIYNGLTGIAVFCAEGGFGKIKIRLHIAIIAHFAKISMFLTEKSIYISIIV